MSITVQANLRDVDASGNNFIWVVVPITFSGSYTTGGDTLSLAPVIQDLPTQEIVQIYAESNSAGASALGSVGGFYTPIGQPGPFGGVNPINNQNATAPGSWKLKAFKNSAGSTTEYSSGAYGTDVTTDYVTLSICLRKLGAF